MDTKSNGIKYSYGMKVTAFLLAALCVLSSAWCCVEITKMLPDYGWKNLLVRENAAFSDTAMFYNELATAAKQVKYGALAGTWEEERAENYDTLEAEQSRALEQFRAFQAQSETEARDRYTYTEESAEEYETTMPVAVTNAFGEAVSTTSASSAYFDETEAQAYLETCQMVYHFRYFSEVALPLNYTMTEDEVSENIETVYNSHLASAKRAFESSVVIANEKLSHYVNFRYLAVNSQTGEVFTNCQTPVKTPEEFYALFENSPAAWVLGVSAERGVVYYSDAVSVDTLYDTEVQELGYDALPDWLGSAFGDDGFDIYLCADLPFEPGDALYTASQTFYNNTNRLGYLLYVAMLLLAAALLLSIYLVLVAGRVRELDGVQFSVLDKIPTDLHFILSWGLAFLGLFGAAALLDAYVFDDVATYYIRNVSLLCLGIALLCAAVYAVLMEWFTSTAKLAKAKKSFVRAMLTAKILLWLFKKCKDFCSWAKQKLQKAKRITAYQPERLPQKAWLFVALYVGVNAILALLLSTSGSWFFTLLCMVAVNVVALVLIWKYVRALDEIIVAAEQSKSGEPPKDLDTDAMPEPLKALAQNLNYTQEEMQKAVQEAVKGERMKTELITNVSHDLKTPLTSIISYVDLLKKCDILDTDAQKYITVLDEKSIRLKRLIEDLVEASKASSGAVTLNKMQVNLYELAVQAVGEMEDGFTERNLQIVLNEPAEAPVVFADSQKTWRIMDNLLSNARKYSLSGSRVYIKVEKVADSGVFTIKNVSGAALNIDPDELTQRFVRGDASRTLEGSGLGLSIAKDLCRLQDGELKLEIDGDLFKATVSLPLYHGEPLQ
ncbi:MAG: HAMP domain-containing sensor histidine kinase [Clostridia bacterium]|nr:HAMP domain-containing sensor histidine kinase [Clostridia bacterium]